MSLTGSDLQARYDAIHDALAGPMASAMAPAEREQLKQEIIALFREADTAATAALAFKAGVKELVDRWKQLDRPATSATVIETAAVFAASGRADHLGASTFVEKGWSKLSLGDPAGAEVALRRALELAPGSNEAESLLGWAQMMQQQYPAARATCEQVLARDPDHAVAHANVGYICLRLGQYDEALQHLARVIRLDLDRKATLYAHLYLGMVYRAREMHDEAEACFRKALELGPNLLQGWYELGRLHWFAGWRDDAIAAWRSGAAANKFSPWGKRCAELLEQVEQGGAPPRDD
ncbi:tetratricopeptide repeat protein [Gemmatimonas sp.]|jgi:tetratricopeptide (TPR) repeat protein|uniref:tetratricopeptide repeat protein n=1 Tax=Gemmatimonas sp. TaxID=1962908 RepID=UPI0037BF1B2D